MSKVDQKSKPNLPVDALKEQNLPARANYMSPAVKQQSSLPAIPGSREVMPLDAKYSDLLKPKETNFKAHFLPVAAIVVFSLILVVLFHMSNPPSAGVSRGVAGNLNDLSSGQYTQQSADYDQEQVCVDQGNGTKSCTTKTKLHRSFR